MDRNYLLDTLFDILNESDALEADLLDLRAEDDGLKVTMKDGSAFKIKVEETKA